MAVAKLSPMMTYYLSLKEQYKDEIVLFRLGDFYEMFFDDAIKASKVLDLTLTGRDCGMSERAPMCGVPYHAVENYIAKLVANGYKVAICEQLSEPKQGKGMVERDVVRVITPGTLIDDYTLEDKKNNYLAVIAKSGKSAAVAWADISTGEFCAVEIAEGVTRQIEDIISSISPSEILASDAVAQELLTLPLFRYNKVVAPFVITDRFFNMNTARQALLAQLKVASMSPYECQDNSVIIVAAGALVQYISQTQKRSLDYISDFKILSTKNYMFLDSNTKRNLEITANSRDGKRTDTLYKVLDYTVTQMGGRLLAKWLDRPLINSIQINDRLNGVEELSNNNFSRDILRENLSRLGDLERIVSKMSYHNEKPSDYVGLTNFLSFLPEIKNIVSTLKTKIILKDNSNIELESELKNLLVSAINIDRPPSVMKDGGLIKEGFNEQLDQLRNAKVESNKWLLKLEADERERTGIKLLKVAYNRVFGFFIEVPNSMKDKVPYRYARKQTLANCERYITDELKQMEDIVLNSEARAIELEMSIIEEIRQSIITHSQTMQRTAQSIASLDVLASLAHVSRKNSYVKPVIREDIASINIESGRHPVVEGIVGKTNYTANDNYLDNGDSRTMIITGPNMAGKSTFMRQVALITLMAHIGSFVPAKSAEIALTDRIFTRVGASDDLSTGQSTFMVEMLEVATILKNCTDKSLLILDEIGRGTSTCDGLSIAWSVIEYITLNYKAKTLFSTHYHELTKLEGVIEGLKNYRVLVSEINDSLVFTHRIARGGANKSYGIEVAKLAGLPQAVIDRACVISNSLEDGSASRENKISIDSGYKNNPELKQLSFFEKSEIDELVDKLSKLNMDNLTPMQSMIELSNFVKIAISAKSSK